jgi:hypothetical protein
MTETAQQIYNQFDIDNHLRDIYSSEFYVKPVSLSKDTLTQLQQLIQQKLSQKYNMTTERPKFTYEYDQAGGGQGLELKECITYETYHTQAYIFTFGRGIIITTKTKVTKE